MLAYGFLQLHLEVCISTKATCKQDRLNPSAALNSCIDLLLNESLNFLDNRLEYSLPQVTPRNFHSFVSDSIDGIVWKSPNPNITNLVITGEFGFDILFEESYGILEIVVIPVPITMHPIFKIL